MKGTLDADPSGEAQNDQIDKRADHHPEVPSSLIGHAEQCTHGKSDCERHRHGDQQERNHEG